MKTIELMFMDRETDTYINSEHMLTDYTKEELQKEVNKILEEKKYLEIHTSYNACDKVFAELVRKKIIQYPKKTFHIYM